ncbi:MAG TPA: VOC family protein [Caulobacteraceae bacterium]|nr:VOC family protein [Caulobacteraceae bacterium]
MPAKFRHLALNADDVQRAKGFYETVFGWRFEPWGPPDYYQAQGVADGVVTALQHRRELKPGTRMAGFEATLAVEDLGAAMAAVEAAGGRVLAPALYIEAVGRLAYFEDTEGNVVGIMQYDAPELGRIAGDAGPPG